MLVLISVSDYEAADEVRHLRAELIADTAWRGRVETVERPPGPGRLGPVLDTLRLALEPALVTPLVAALVGWLRYRTSDVELTVRRPDDEMTVTVSGKRVRRLDAVTLTAEVAQLAARLTDPDRSDAGD